MLQRTEAWVRLITLERAWGWSRTQILDLAWPRCGGDLDSLNTTLKQWQKEGRPQETLN